MPLRWKIDHEQKTLVVRGEGVVLYEDLEPLLQEIGRAGIGSFGKLIDLSKADVGRDPARLLMAAARLRQAHSEREVVGPLALVTTRDVPAELLGALAAADRYMRGFPTELRARRWLAKAMGAAAKT